MLLTMSSMLHSNTRMPTDKSPNPIAQKLRVIMEQKQTNLACAADVTTKKEILELADHVGPYICILKTHIDIINDFDEDLIAQLQQLAHKHNFLICEDRKFADIGSTVEKQYAGGIYHIADWADIVIAHAVLGHDSITALYKAAPHKEHGILLLAQSSALNNLIDRQYTQKVIEIAQQHPDMIIGFIAQEQCTEDPRFIHIAPGVHAHKTADSKGQSYNTVETIIQNGIDIVIVGRGIYEHPDPASAARSYRQTAWQAYCQKQ